MMRGEPYEYLAVLTPARLGNRYDATADLNTKPKEIQVRTRGELVSQEMEERDANDGHMGN